MKKNVIVFIYLSLIAACGNRQKTDLRILFEEVPGLMIGSEVKMNGFTIGEVVSMKLLDQGILVNIHFSEKIRMPKNSKFLILSPLIGSPTINIEPSIDSDYITEKDTAIGKLNETKPLDYLMSDSTQKKEVLDALNKIADGIKELVELKKDTVQFQ